MVNASENILPNLEDVLRRLKSVVGAENDHQLARKIGIAQTTVSTWRKRQKIPYEVCTNIARRYNKPLDWMLFGEAAVSLDAMPEYGFIALDFFGSCWRAAEEIVKIAPNMDIRLAAALLYNFRLESFLKFAGRDLSLEQATFAFAVMDDVRSIDFAQWAEVLQREIAAHKSLEGVFETDGGG